MRIAMIGWEYPPFKAGGLATHCYGLTRSLADKNVKVYFFNAIKLEMNIFVK